MLPRFVTLAYLVYLALPIVLLIVGSIGESWLNTLLPSGATGRWYVEVRKRSELSPRIRHEPVRRHDGVHGVRRDRPARSRTRYFARGSARVRAVARALYQLPVALPALVLAFGLHPRVLVGHAAMARQRLGC
jgi:putative spermidine/putrescine transport system permease protein